MKYIIFTLIIFISISSYSQLNAGDAQDAWERTSYKKWDDFNPFWYFLFKRKYKKTDRRTIYARVGQMTLWSIYADEYEMHQRSVDSILKQETYKALDKSLNKNYLVLQRPRVLKLYEQIGESVELAIESDLPEELFLMVEERYFAVRNNIEFLKDTYSADAEKYPLIEDEIRNLEKLLTFANNLDTYAIFWKEDVEADLLFIIEDALELNIIEINSLVKE